MARNPEDPRNTREWFEAVDQAAFFLALDDCRMYGLIEGGPGVRRERCLEILERAAQRGIKPRPLGDLIRDYLTG